MAMPAEIRLADVIGSECSAPDCSADSMDDVPFPICSDHYLNVVRHYHQLTRSVGLVANEFDESLGLGRVPIEPIEEPVDVVPHVYFIQYRDRVKIGTSINVRKRIAALPHERVLAIIPGDGQIERDWHARFALYRDTGEWFALAPKHIATIEALGICA